MLYLTFDTEIFGAGVLVITDHGLPGTDPLVTDILFGALATVATIEPIGPGDVAPTGRFLNLEIIYSPESRLLKTCSKVFRMLLKTMPW